MQKKQRIFDPVGWDSLGKKYTRDEEMFGVFFQYSPKLQFIKDGRSLIHYFYERYGISANITLFVYKKNRRTRYYDNYYQGKLNLTDLSVTPIYASCNCEQVGFIQKFKNRQDVKVDLSLATSQERKAISLLNTVDITLPSKVIRKIFKRDKSYRVVPDTWESTETYSTDQVVYWNLKNWKSLSGGNIGNTPVEGAYWTEATVEETGLQLTTIDFADDGQVWYIKPSFDPTTLSMDELETRQSYGLQASQIDPVEALKYDFVVEFGGTYIIDITSYNRLIVSSGGGSGEFEMVLVYGKQGNYTEEVIGTTGPAWTFATDLYSYDDTYTVQLQPNDEIYIFWRLTFTTGSPTIFIFLEDYIVSSVPANLVSNITITADTLYPDTSLTMMLKHEAFARVSESITDKKDVFRSTYYGRTNSQPHSYSADGEGSIRGISPGKLIRNFPAASNHIYASFADLFKTAQAIDGVGMGIEMIDGKQYIVVEKLNHFFNSTRSVQIPYVRDIEKVVLEKYYYNELEGGYDKWGDEAVGNLDEFNARREYTLPISEVKNKLVLKSPYPASSYLVEQVRRDSYFKSNTKDNKFDNDNFIFQLKRDGLGYRVEHTEDYEVITNVISPETLINARLSPMRNLLRNGAYIRSGLFHEADQEIKLAFGEANTEMSSRLPGEDYGAILPLLSEKSIQVSKLDRALWIPEAYKFKAKLTQENLELIEANLYGYIEFAVDDKSWKKGYLLEMEPEPDSELTTFKLLRANL